MKKLLALLMAGAMTVTAFAGCSVSVKDKDKEKESKTESAAAATADSAPGEDWTYLENKGTFTVGITYFEPMNYKLEDGTLTGFETEFTEAVCAEMGLTPKFQEIEWDSKELELSSKSIDCIWNGMTITDERKQNMTISVPYMENKQVMVVKKDRLEALSQSVDGLNVVAEAGSAGEDVANAAKEGSDAFFANAVFESVEAQSTALLEVKAGTADVAVIDYIMALGTLREGSDFEDLAMVTDQSFAPEQYGVALRKDSNTTVEKLNAAIQKVADSGKLKEIADKYNLGDMLLVKPQA